MKFLRRLIRYLLIHLGEATGTQIKVSATPKIRINLHPDAVSDGGVCKDTLN